MGNDWRVVSELSDNSLRVQKNQVGKDLRSVLDAVDVPSYLLMPQIVVPVARVDLHRIPGNIVRQGINISIDGTGWDTAEFVIKENQVMLCEWITLTRSTGDNEVSGFAFRQGATPYMFWSTGSWMLTKGVLVAIW